jgi:hypothetical protein
MLTHHLFDARLPFVVVVAIERHRRCPVAADPSTSEWS